MKRRTMILAICIGIALLAMLAIQYSTQAQRPERTGRSSGGQVISRMLPLEQSWAQICFELDVADGALPRLRKIYQNAWDRRKNLMKRSEEAAGNRDAMRTIRSDAEKVKSDLAMKLKDVLSGTQLEKLAEWEKKSQERTQRSRRPPTPPSGAPQPE